VKLPTEVPVMVLPHGILFPQAMLPLHIFEDRYRRMLNDSLGTHRMFAIGTVRKDEQGNDEDEKEGFYDVFGVGLVRAAINQADGTSNLILQGLYRARVVKMVGGKPYPRARVEPLSSFGGDHIAIDALSAKVAELVTVRSKFGTAVPETALKFLVTLRDRALCVIWSHLPFWKIVMKSRGS
jgi:uncharacterized protein